MPGGRRSIIRRTADTPGSNRRLQVRAGGGRRIMLTTMPTSLHHRAIEHLGARIVAGELPAGHVMLAEQLENELKVSRSVVREAVRVLQSLGLVETPKRVGIRVRPASRSDIRDR